MRYLFAGNALQKLLPALFCLLCNLSYAGDTLQKYSVTIPGSAVSFTMMPIPGGNFVMGSPATEQGRQADEGTALQVKISPFWMGACEVTYDEYNLFFNDESFERNSDVDAITRPSSPYLDFSLGMGKEGGFPANSMQQHGAIMYCKWLYYKTGVFYRLPTEAEWEYACRAGTNNKVYPLQTDSLKKYAWFKNNSEGSYHKTGLLQPNAWGLYDMLGNVAEWVLDEYVTDYFARLKDGDVDPVVLPTKRYPRTVKGGHYNDGTQQQRPAARLMSDPVWNRRDPQLPKSKWWNADAPFVGFRIVRPLKQPTKEEITAFFDRYLNL